VETGNEFLEDGPVFEGHDQHHDGGDEGDDLEEVRGSVHHVEGVPAIRIDETGESDEGGQDQHDDTSERGTIAVVANDSASSMIMPRSRTVISR